MTCDPRIQELLFFHYRIAVFDAFTDSPRDYLERFLEPIAALEGAVNAFVAINVEGTRQAGR